MNRMMLIALLGIVFVMGCQSGEYQQAYEYAKNEGRSELKTINTFAISSDLNIRIPQRNQCS